METIVLFEDVDSFPTIIINFDFNNMSKEQTLRSKWFKKIWRHEK